MKEAGVILHCTKGGNYVIEAKFKVLPQTTLYNSTSKKVAVSIDLIGPIDRPFIIAKPLLESPEKMTNTTLYVKMEKEGRGDFGSRKSEKRTKMSLR